MAASNVFWGALIRTKPIDADVAPPANCPADQFSAFFLEPTGALVPEPSVNRSTSLLMEREVIAPAAAPSNVPTPGKIIVPSTAPAYCVRKGSPLPKLKSLEEKGNGLSVGL